MRSTKDPNHPSGGSTKVNGQDPTRPRKVDANLMAQADDDNHSEYDNSNQYDDEWHTDDSAPRFLIQIRGQRSRLFS